MRTRASITLTKLSGKVHSWTDKKLSSARAWLRKLTKELAKELDGYKWLSGVLLLPCLILWTKSTLILLAVVGVVLASVHYGKFLWWAHKWSQRLVADRREIPSLRELGKVRETIKKREKTLADHWPDRCTMNGLRRVPMLTDIQATLDLDLVAQSPRNGVDPDDIKDKAPKLAKGLGCQSIIVRETAPGCSEIKFNWTNPLRREYPLRDMPPASSEDKGAFGMEASSEAVSLDLDMSTAFIGSARSGKSVTQDAWLCDRVDAGEWLNIYMSNPKTNEGKAFKAYADLPRQGRVKVVAYAEGEKPGPHVALINKFEQDMAERNRNMAGKKLTKSTADNPRCILWLDEMLLLPKSVYKDTANEFSPLRRILAGGPAAMFTVIGGTQLVYSEDLGAVKGLFTQRVVFRLPSPEITETAFFRGAVAQGALCHKLHKTRDRGVGWALNDDGELTQFRSPKVEDADLDRALRGLPTPGRNLDRKEIEAPASQRVYFIEAQGTDLVKVGIAAEPTGRLKELQTASPHKLAILATMPGGRAKEYQLHRRFASSRATGEWFHRTPELDALILEAASGAFEEPATGHHPVQHARQWIGDKRTAHREAHPHKPAVWGPDDLWWEAKPAWRH